MGISFDGYNGCISLCIHHSDRKIVLYLKLLLQIREERLSVADTYKYLKRCIKIKFNELYLETRTSNQCYETGSYFSHYWNSIIKIQCTQAKKENRFLIDKLYNIVTYNYIAKSGPSYDIGNMHNRSQYWISISQAEKYTFLNSSADKKSVQ